MAPTQGWLWEHAEWWLAEDALLGERRMGHTERMLQERGEHSLERGLIRLWEALNREEG